MEIPLNALADFDNHRLVSYVFDPATGLEGFIALHRGGLEVPAFGATRAVVYADRTEALRDALQLSRFMSYKAALAGLRNGGAKGVILARPNDTPVQRRAWLQAYSNKVNYFGGRFVTGADMGVSARDVKIMSDVSEYMVGVSSDPVHFTALGLLAGLEEAFAEIFGSSSLKNRTFAMIQGKWGKLGQLC